MAVNQISLNVIVRISSQLAVDLLELLGECSDGVRWSKLKELCDETVSTSSLIKYRQRAFMVELDL